MLRLGKTKDKASNTVGGLKDEECIVIYLCIVIHALKIKKSLMLGLNTQ